MQFSIEKQEGLVRLVKVTVPKEKIQEDYQKQLRKTQGVAKLDGFRKGHVPLNVVAQHYGLQVLEDVVNDAVQGCLPEVIKETGMTPVLTPHVNLDWEKVSPEEELTFEIEFEVAPTLETRPLDELSFKLVDCSISDSDIDAMIEDLRQRQAKWQDEDGLELAEGLMARLDFKGFMNGEPMEGASRENVPYRPELSQMPEDFKKAVLGHKAGDTFRAPVHFPDDFSAENMRGKDTEFEISVKGVSRPILPEINADFFKLYGVKESSLEAFRSELCRNMQREMRKFLRSINHMRVHAELLKQYGEFEIPKGEVDADIDRIRHDEVRRLTDSNVLPEKEAEKFMSTVDREIFRARAERDVRLGYIYRTLVESLGVKEVDADRVEAALTDIASAFEDPENVKRQLRKDANEMMMIRSLVMEDQFVDKVCAGAKHESEPVTFHELTTMVENMQSGGNNN